MKDVDDFSLKQFQKYQLNEFFFLEIEKIKNLEAKPSSLFSLLITLEHFFSFDFQFNSENLSQSLKTFHSWCYEASQWVKSYSKEKSNVKIDEKENLNKMNSYFFELQKLTISRDEDLKPLDLSLEHTLKRKKGAPFLISLLYWHLALKLKISVHLVDFFNYPILKWVYRGETYFIDLIHKGKILKPRQTLKLMQSLSLALKEKKRQNEKNEENEFLEYNFKSLHPHDSSSSNSMETLNIRSAFKRYLELFLKALKNSNALEKSFEKSIFILNTLLKVEPSKISFLAEKAIIYKKAGQKKEALRNFRRYFSFIEKENAPLKLQEAYKELITQLSSFNIKDKTLH